MSKEAYQQKAEAKLDEHKAEVDKARAKVKGATADARLDAERELKGLEAKLDEAKQMLAQIKDAGEDAWEDLTEGLENAWDDVAGAAKKIMGRFS